MLSPLSASQTARFGNAAEISEGQHLRHFFTASERMLRSVFERGLKRFTPQGRRYSGQRPSTIGFAESFAGSITTCFTFWRFHV
jgi:hypothetical protein